MLLGLAAAAQAIQLVGSIMSGGITQWQAFKGFLAQNGIQADLDKLDAMLAEDYKRAAAREAEAQRQD
jgi:hypothetical protein